MHSIHAYRRPWLAFVLAFILSLTPSHASRLPFPSLSVQRVAWPRPLPSPSPSVADDNPRYEELFAIFQSQFSMQQGIVPEASAETAPSPEASAEESVDLDASAEPSIEETSEEVTSTAENTGAEPQQNSMGGEGQAPQVGAFFGSPSLQSYSSPPVPASPPIVRSIRKRGAAMNRAHHLLRAASRPLHRTIFSAPQSMATDPARNFFPLSSAANYRTKVLLLKGADDTIGQEVTASLTSLFSAAKAPIAFVTPTVDLALDDGLTQEVVDLFTQTRVAVKGPYFTPLGSPRTSINIQLRKQFDLFANVVHAYNVPGVATRHNGVDIVIIRENTEGEYSGLEHSVVPGVVESLKIITREKSMRIAEYAFQYAVANDRKKVTAVHKANIMKSADGLFLECCTEVAKQYPFIDFETMIVDNTCMQMTSRPQQFDVMVLPNLYGNIVTNIATGLVGGPGLFPGANIGQTGAIFEQGSRHSARSLAGQQLANPTATVLGGVLMLRYLKMEPYADAIESAVMRVFKDTNLRTRDLAGDTSTTKAVSTDEFTSAVIDHLEPVQ